MEKNPVINHERIIDCYAKIFEYFLSKNQNRKENLLKFS